MSSDDVIKFRDCPHTFCLVNPSLRCSGFPDCKFSEAAEAYLAELEAPKDRRASE